MKFKNLVLALILLVAHASDAQSPRTTPPPLFSVMDLIFPKAAVARRPADSTAAVDVIEGPQTTYKASEWNGTWMLYDFECPEGYPVRKDLRAFKSKPEFFAQFTFSSETLVMSGKNLQSGCKFEGELTYKIINDNVVPQKTIRAIEKCPGKPDKDDTEKAHDRTPAKLAIRSSPSGEKELLLGVPRLCQGNVPGSVVLRRIPLG